MPPAAEQARQLVRRFDRNVDSALDRWPGHPAVDRLFYSASALGDHSLIWLFLGALRGLRSEQGWKAALRVGAGMGIESALVNLGIKSLFQRGRPSWEGSRPHGLRQPRTSAFPSGHATSAFTAAGLLADQDRWWPAYYLLAGVVSSSRVYVRIHHASDVLAGAMVGVVLGRVGRRLVRLPPAA